MLRRLMVLIFLAGVPLLAHADAAARPASAPAATEPAAKAPVLTPIMQANLPNYIDWPAQTIPGSRDLLIGENVPVLSVSEYLVEYWRWWLGGLLAGVWLVPAWRLGRKWRRRLMPGFEYCRECRYCLEGAVGATCPECGAAIDKANRIAGKSLRGSLVALLVCLALFAGGYAALGLTAPAWEDWVVEQYPMESEKCARLAGWLGLHDWWTSHHQALVEFDPVAGRRVGIATWFAPENQFDNPDRIILSGDGTKAIFCYYDGRDGGMSRGLLESFDLVDLRKGTREHGAIGALREKSGMLDHALCLSYDGSYGVIWLLDETIQRFNLQTGKATTIATVPLSWQSYERKCFTADPDHLLIVDFPHDDKKDMAQMTMLDLHTGAVEPRGRFPGLAMPFLELQNHHDLPEWTIYNFNIQRAYAYEASREAFFQANLELPLSSAVIVLWGRGVSGGSTSPWEFTARETATGRIIATFDVHGLLDVDSLFMSGDQTHLVVFGSTKVSYGGPDILLTFDVASLRPTGGP